MRNEKDKEVLDNEREVNSSSQEVLMGDQKMIEEMKREAFNLDGFAINGVAWFSWPSNSFK